MTGASPSPYAFLVNGSVFFDPHAGMQRELLRRLSHRVMTGEGPSKFFLRGNRGGGKSVTIRKGLLHGLAMAIPGLRYGVVRRNMPDLFLNHLQYLHAEMSVLGGEYVQSPHPVCRYENGSMGFYRQCENFADVEKIVGSELGVLFIDEAPQIAWDNLALMFPSLRVARAGGRQPFYTLAVLSGNPTGDSIEELDKHFLDKTVSVFDNPHYVPEDWEHIPLFLKDNPSLDPDEYLKQLGPVPPAFRAAWIDGVRMDARTLFEVKKTVDGQPYHYIQELPTIGGVSLLRVPWIQVYRAFDMGFFPDPAACLWLAVFGRRIIAVHEETWFKTIAKDLAAKMIETTRELVGETPCAMTYVDPTIDTRTGSDTVTVMDTIEMNGVPCEAAVNDRVLYADAIHSLLGEEIEPGVPRFQVYEPGCPMLAKYLPKMRWDEKNPRKMADHQFDHWIVCLAYFAIASGVLSNARAETITTRPAWMDWMHEGQRVVGRRSAD
jgi:hypothetical protein